MKKRIILLLTIALFISEYSWAQFKATVEVRPRAELRNGYKTLLAPNQDVAFFIDQRSRLNLQYDEGPVQVGLSVQDIRVWGSTSQLNTSDDYLSVHQAWAKVGLAKGIAVKAGRQEIVYDNHRIFGNVGWAQQARSHDAVVLKLNGFATKFDLGLAFNQNQAALSSTYYSGLNNYKTLQFAWWNEKISDNFELSFLGMNQGIQVTTSPVLGVPKDTIKTVYNHMVGTHIKAPLDDIEWNASFYYQFGDQANWQETTLDAVQASLEATFKPSPGNSTIGLGIEYLSGTKASDKENKSFTPWFGTNHKFNGHMDYFFVGNHMNNIGLLDFYTKIGLQKDGWGFNAHTHVFQGAAEVANEDAYLGTELDLSLSNSIGDDKAKVVLGYSQMFFNDSLEALKGVTNPNKTQNWVWLMMNVNLEVLNISKGS